MGDLAERVRAEIEGDLAVELARTYFHYQKDSGDPYFSGALFERLGGGGDRSNVKDVVNGDDILAVNFLSVEIKRDVCVAFVESKAEQISHLLKAIPVTVDLWDAPVQMLGPRSEASQLWQIFKGRYRFVTASKLLARKRPRLIPVHDRVVERALGTKVKTLWQDLRLVLQDARKLDRLAHIRSEVEAEWVSPLRILDAVVWMRHHGYTFLPPEHEVRRLIDAE